MSKIFLFLFLLIICACSQQSNVLEPDQKIFKQVSYLQSDIKFKNQINESANLNGILYEYLYNGGGVAAGDVNGDELPDLIFISNLTKSEIYLNKGDLKFEEVSVAAGFNPNEIGFPTGVTLVDINADGKLDIYVSKSGKFSNPEHRKNLLYVNLGNDDQGTPSFVESAAQYGLDLPHHSTQASFFDYDLDGDLDMFLINHGIKSYEDHLLPELLDQPSEFQAERLFQNQNGFYKDISEEAGIINNSLSFGLGLAIGDLNNDGWPDVLVGHDFSEKDHLYLNQQNGTFKEIINESTGHISFFSMGNDIADINNDGWLDFMTVDMVSERNYDIKTSMSGMNPQQFQTIVDQGLHHQYMYNALQLNRGVHQGLPRFSEVAQLTGVSSTDWSWAPLFFDADNDGFKDLFVANGVKRDFRNNDYVNYKNQRFAQFFKEHPENSRGNKLKARTLTAELTQKMLERKKPNYFFRNGGSDLSFTKENWLGQEINASNGAVYADLDLDGDLDLVLNNMDDLATIYENRSESNHYLKVNLIGENKNPKAIGSRVTTYVNGSIQMQELQVTRGFQSAMLGSLHFGLGSHEKVDSLVVHWPGGKVSKKVDVFADQTIELNISSGKKLIQNEENSNPYFVDKTETMNLSVAHQENEFNDFERESLLPHQMSRLGPALANADIDGDGMDDLFLGGAIGQSGAIFFQSESGFARSNQDGLDSDQLYEDVAAVFFDIDNDGDQDLYVVSGSNEYELGSKYLQDRVYKNENGQFKKVSIQDLPTNSGGCLAWSDIDQDGDLDLFVGGRQVPGQYPVSADSYVLINESERGNINFKKRQTLEDLGMVTSATWADFNGDGWQDLLVVGEWMAPQIYWNENGLLKAEETSLSDETGWWQCVLAHDFDQDGDIDFVAGNNGLNYKYKASHEAPFEIYYSDFDQNGHYDIVLAYPEEGTVYPLRGRECSSNQVPSIKEKFKSYHDFGQASIADIYGADQLSNALHKQVKNFASSYFENLGNGKFSVRPLPVMAQLSSVNDIQMLDANGNGKTDLLLAGNNYTAEVETPRNDASIGVVLLGDDLGNFKALDATFSGLFISGDVRAMKILGGTSPKIVVARNNDVPQVIQFKKYKK